MVCRGYSSEGGPERYKESHWGLAKRLEKKNTSFGEYYPSKTLKSSLAHAFFLIGIEDLFVPGLTAGHSFNAQYGQASPQAMSSVTMSTLLSTMYIHIIVSSSVHFSNSASRPGS